MAAGRRAESAPMQGDAGSDAGPGPRARGEAAARAGGAAARPSRREALAALAVALLVALLAVGGAVLRPGTVFFALDTASAQLPWSATPEACGLAVANPALSDQGVCFYPFYRWVSRSWRAGDPPLWCPLVYAGAPGFGNAQSGALDPQVLALVLLDALGGLDLFHAGFAWVAWLRVALAGLGAYLLARRLGLLPAPAALAGATFAFSGYLILWLNHPLGHVPPLLPWVLAFLEDLRGRARLRAAAGPMAKVAVCLALAIYGGHAETAFYVGAASGLWALALLREERRAGAHGLVALGLGTGLAGLTLAPLTEYLGRSAAQAVRAAEAAQATAHIDLVALGVLVVAAGVVIAGRARLEPRGPSRAVVAAGLGLAVLGALVFLARRGLGPSASLALVPDLLGAPGAGGYRGEGNYIERASPWVAFAALAFALASLLAPRGALRRRGLVALIGGLSFLLTVELPGLLELFRLVPLVGLGDTVRFAAVGSLMLGLLAGDALQAAPRAARWAALVALAPLCAAALAPARLAPLDASVAVGPETDELVGFALVPERAIDGSHSALEGWWGPGVPAARARARVERVDEAGRLVESSPLVVELALFDAPSDAARRSAPEAVSAAPAGARWFRTPFLLTGQLSDGHWRTELELLGADGATLGTRLVRVSTLERAPRRSAASVGALALGLVALALVPAAPAPAAWLVVLLALAQGALFARGINPAVPRAAVFPPTRTEALLAEGLGPWRFFSDPGVLPPDTGLVRGLRGVEGYDAMDVAAFNEFRQHALPEGSNPLLAWNPRGVDLDHPAFRLLGVGMLALSEPIEHPGWELVASPRDDPPCETWLYRARDPLPRAFCVPRVVSLDELGALVRRDPAAFDPLALASLDDAWRPARPYTSAKVSEPRITNNRVELDVALDGDGLLVVTEQSFPGWQAFVDGEPAPLHTADMIFRGVPLAAGEHAVELVYRPRSVLVGALATVACLVALAGLVAVVLRRRT